ncbi:MAG: ABC transporter substrate-binding protein [Rhodococcus sp. (in: high G+C Gram-positive bacteria)]|uniref:ABC transporter substrate-binding protein n=1 Tax=Rhodococcus sp. TaxID=1831 RepID=UPI003BB06F21
MPRRWIGAALAVVAFLAVSCGVSGTSETGKSRPAAIVSLSPSITEMLFAVGAGDQVVAVDDRSNFPAQAPVTELSGYTPNVEAILGYEPDLVIISEDAGDLVAGLKNVGVPTLVLPAATTLDDTYDQIEQIGATTWHTDEATELVDSMQRDVENILAGLPDRDAPLTYYHELDDTFYSVTDDTFIGHVYSMLGVTSIATGADAYPQLSPEFILDSNPDLIFLADGQCCGVTPETVASRAGWGELTAVRAGRVHVLDENIASRWGPRVVDLVRELGALVAAVPAPTS